MLLGITIASAIASPLLLSDVAARHLPGAARSVLGATLMFTPWAIQVFTVAFRMGRGGRRILNGPLGREDMSFQIYATAALIAAAFGRQLGVLAGPLFGLSTTHRLASFASLAVLAAWGLIDTYGKRGGRVPRIPAD